jgi:hypothetical protein
MLIRASASVFPKVVRQMCQTNIWGGEGLARANAFEELSCTTVSSKQCLQIMKTHKFKDIYLNFADIIYSSNEI